MTNREGTPTSSTLNRQAPMEEEREYAFFFPVSTPPAAERRPVHKTPSPPLHVTPPTDDGVSSKYHLEGTSQENARPTRIAWPTNWTSPRYTNPGFPVDNYGYNPSFCPPPYSPAIHPTYQHPIPYQSPWQYQYAWNSPGGSFNTPHGARSPPSARSGYWHWAQCPQPSATTSNGGLLHSAGNRDESAEKRKFSDLGHAPDIAAWKKRKWCHGAEVWPRLSGGDNDKENEEPLTNGEATCDTRDNIGRNSDADDEEAEGAGNDDANPTTPEKKQKVWYKPIQGGEARYYKTKEGAEEAMKHLVEGGSCLRAQGTKVPSNGKIGKQWYFSCKESSCPLLVRVKQVEHVISCPLLARVKEVEHVISWEGTSQRVVWYVVEASTSKKNGQSRAKHNHSIPQYENYQRAFQTRSGATPV